jgi:hypothetical protein
MFQHGFRPEWRIAFLRRVQLPGGERSAAVPKSPRHRPSNTEPKLWKLRPALNSSP